MLNYGVVLRQLGSLPGETVEKVASSGMTYPHSIWIYFLSGRVLVINSEYLNSDNLDVRLYEQEEDIGRTQGRPVGSG